MKTEQITLTAEYTEHGQVTLKNKKGDTYTSKSESLMDFLFNAESSEQRYKDALENIVKISSYPEKRGHFETVFEMTEIAYEALNPKI